MAVQKSKIGFVVAGLLLGILMASMDNTIVATAMGTIVGELGGFDKFVWVTTAYMVAEMAGMPIFGKLSDMYGRKRFFVFGLSVFLLGSILCGTANSIELLTIYRAIQGIGGGALIPIAFTIMFDIFPVEKRGKMGGLFGAVFGLSSIFGPLLGALITDTVGWNWIFYINLPIGLFALFFIIAFYKESVVHKAQKIDWWGAVTLVGAVVCLIFALELGGVTYDWDSVMILSLFAGFAVLFALFLFVEKKAVEPILSYAMFKVRLYAASNIIALFSGAGFIAAAVYIPIFVQGVLGGTATNSGLILLPMMLGTTVSAQIGGFLATRMSYRQIMTLFSLVFVLGIYLLSTLSADATRLTVTIYMIVVGLGIGASFSVLGMAGIHHFDASQRGSANSTLVFLRTLGMTIGITVFGILQRNNFSSGLQDLFASVGSEPLAGISSDPRQLLLPATRARIPEPILEKITSILSSSITYTFMWAIVPAALALAFTLFMSRERLKIDPQARQMKKVHP